MAEALRQDMLRQELLSIPGIADAEVDDDRGVAGVRVQLAEGADAAAVGVAVRRLLIEHGMRPSPGDGEESPHVGPPPPPGAPGSVVSFPLVGEHAAGAPTAEVAATLESVAIEETRDGVSVLVRSNSGVTVSRSLDSSGSGMDEAVAAAVAELAGQAGAGLVGAAEADMGGHTVVTVLVAVGEQQVSGSAIQRGGRAYAVAKAVWSALERA